MKKTYLLFFVVLQILSCKKQEFKIQIAVASSLQPVFQELLKDYSNEYANEIQLIHSSSGRLASQIVNGASYTIFFSADKSYSEYVKKELRLSQNSKAFVKGTLVRVANKKLLKHIKWDQAKYIAIANPNVAPYGRLAEEFLKGETDYEDIEQHLVYGQNVNQVLQYLLTNNVEVAFLSKGSVSGSVLDTSVFDCVTLDTSRVSDIIHSYIVLQPSEKLEDFTNFLKSSKAKIILRKYGYVPL